MRHPDSPHPGRSAPLPHSDLTDLNRVHLTGWLGSEPLLRDVGEHPVAELCLVSTRCWRAADGRLELARTWFNLTATDELAEHCARLLHQGDRVYLEGTLQLWSEQRGSHSALCHTILLDRIDLLVPGSGGAASGTAEGVIRRRQLVDGRTGRC